MLHLARVVQMVNSNSRATTLQSQLVLVGRLGQLTLVAYLKLLRVVLAERLWAIPPHVRRGTRPVDDIPARKEISR
jgi:hypothetical protein